MATKTRTPTRPLFATDDFGALHWLAALAALVTAAIHLFLATRIVRFNPTMGYLFALDGLGFLGGVGLYLSRYWRRSLYLVAIGYTLIQIAAWTALGMGGGALGIVDKAIQVGLVVLAGYLYARE